MARLRLRAGKMRSLVRIQEVTDTPDSAGALNLSYADVPTNPQVWVEIKPFGSGAGEVVTAEAVRTTDIVNVTMRYRRDVTEKGRLIEINPGSLNRVLSIQSVTDPDGRKRWLELVCESGRILEEE